MCICFLVIFCSCRAMEKAQTILRASENLLSQTISTLPQNEKEEESMIEGGTVEMDMGTKHQVN